MTTAQPLNQIIIINDRPAQLQRHIDALNTYSRASAEALARHQAERKLLEREKKILVTTGQVATVFGFILGTTVHPILLLIAAVGIGMILWAMLSAGQRLNTLNNNPPPHLSGRCTTAAWLLANLHDDLASGRRVTGQIDLRSTEQDSIVRRELPGRWQTTISYIYHCWLDLGARLVDGNELRLKCTERLKVRPGHFRTGSVSRKRKWKPDQRNLRQRVAVGLRVNPSVYASAASRLLPAHSRVGRLTVLHAAAQGNELRVVAEVDGDQLIPEEILLLLRQIYAGLVRSATRKGAR